MLVIEAMIRARKRKNGEISTQKRTSTANALKGTRICINAFAAVLQLSTATIWRHCTEISNSKTVQWYETSKNKNRMEKHGIQRIEIHAFLLSIARDYGMECLRGKGSMDEAPLRLLSPNFTKTTLYAQYK